VGCAALRRHDVWAAEHRSPTKEVDLVLDPFLGGGTTAVACVRLKRGCVGVEADLAYISIAAKRADGEIIELWLREFRVEMTIAVIEVGAARCAVRAPSGRNVPAALPPGTSQRDVPTFLQNDLDLFGRSMDRINGLKESEPKTDCIFHETKFVLLSCATVSTASVVHTTVETTLQEAWAKTPNGKKKETTHIVRCETEIFRVNSGV
jgi:DNA methylase